MTRKFFAITALTLIAAATGTNMAHAAPGNMSQTVPTTTAHGSIQSVQYILVPAPLSPPPPPVIYVPPVHPCYLYRCY